MILRQLKNFIKDENGSQTVEFMIALPLVLQMVAIVLLTMQMVYAKDVALNAASLGCRSAIVQSTFSKAQADATQKAEVYASQVGMGVSFIGTELTAEDGWQRGSLAHCTAIVQADPIFKFIVVNTPVNISQTAVMMIEK